MNHSLISFKIEVGDYFNEVDSVFESGFEFKFPFGMIAPVARANEFVLSIGVTNKQNQADATFHYVNITFYDPKCRSFENETLSPDLLPDTCIEPVNMECSIYKVIEF